MIGVSRILTSEEMSKCGPKRSPYQRGISYIHSQFEDEYFKSQAQSLNFWLCVPWTVPNVPLLIVMMRELDLGGTIRWCSPSSLFRLSCSQMHALCRSSGLARRNRPPIASRCRRIGSPMVSCCVRNIPDARYVLIKISPVAKFLVPGLYDPS